MIRKPNAILHMTRYGFVYGFLFAMIYMWVAIFILSPSGNSFSGIDEIVQAIAGTSILSLIFGSIPGTVIGFVEGWILWLMTMRTHPPLPQQQLNSMRVSAVMVIGALTLFGVGGLLALINFAALMFFIIPLLIAAGASAYAANHYVMKLQAWGINNIEKPKNKEKHIPKNKLGYENETASVDYSGFESDAQEMNR